MAKFFEYQGKAILKKAGIPIPQGEAAKTPEEAKAIAKKLGLPKTQVEGIYMVGVIHDLGKISVPSEILSMPRRLTEAEFNLVVPCALHHIFSLSGPRWPLPGLKPPRPEAGGSSH